MPLKLRTEISPRKHSGLISHSTPVLLLGSCFSDNIGERLRRDLFNVAINPSGALYNPESILNAARRIGSGSPYSIDDLFLHEGQWHSFDHHSSFSAEDTENALTKINSSLSLSHEMMKECGCAIITMGSTRVFRNVDNGNTVANCHKLPANRFREADLSVEESTVAITETIKTLRAVNPNMPIILTVSPIRHLAYGLEGNSLGKAKLRVAIDNVVSATTHVYYFPSYEIMLDDLRDYRFYAPDMKHPSEQAIDYIYEQFCNTFMDTETLNLAAKCRELTKRLSHRLNETTASKKFRDETIALANTYAEQWPFLKRAISQILQL